MNINGMQCVSRARAALLCGVMLSTTMANVASAAIECVTIASGVSSTRGGDVIVVGQSTVGTASGATGIVDVGVLACLYPSPSQPSVGPSDINHDGCVDGADLGLLLAAWGDSSAESDLNRDGLVDGADLGMVLSDWGLGDC